MAIIMYRMKMWQRQRAWSAESLQQALNQVGFERVQIKGITWGNELIKLACFVLKRKPAGVLSIAQR